MRERDVAGDAGPSGRGAGRDDRGRSVSERGLGRTARDRSRRADTGPSGRGAGHDDRDSSESERGLGRTARDRSRRADTGPSGRGAGHDDRDSSESERGLGRTARDRSRRADTGASGRGAGHDDRDSSESERGLGRTARDRSRSADTGPSGRGTERDDNDGFRAERGGDRGSHGRGRGQRFGEEFDMVVSRPNAQGDGVPLMKKQADPKNCRIVKLKANYFKVESRPDWGMYHYRVDFKPDEPDTRIKKRLFRPQSQVVGANIFDDSSLYTAHRLSPDPMVLYGSHDNNEDRVEMTIRMVAELGPTDTMYLQIFNILVRKCLAGMQLEEMGRHFYDRHQAITFNAHKLELWPGYITTMRNHEDSILLRVEITHKVLRLDTCLDVINNIYRHSKDQSKVKNEIVGSIVMTHYNRKTYRVDDIEWGKNPTDTFDMNGKHFRQKYSLTIRDHRQPLLLSRPKKRDLHRGQTGPMLLVPELCQMTGLTDEMRANNQLMRALATHLHTDPSARIAKLHEFMHRIRTAPTIVEELNRWGLRFRDRLIELEGHVIPPEPILFGANNVEIPNDICHWNQAFRNKQMLSTVPLKQWVIICPSSAAWCVDKMVNSMQRVARPLNFQIASPAPLHRISNDRTNDYAKGIDDVMSLYKKNLQLLFVILPRQVVDVYSVVKKRASIEFGVPSQCFVAKNAQNDKNLTSICSNLVVQINAKLGGEPWTVQIPIKKLMIVGFDVYHCAKGTGRSIGAMVATTTPTHAKYFSTISQLCSRNELSDKVGADFTKCLHVYLKINGDLPDRIIMYRDGVGEGQLRYVYETELKNIKDAMMEVYKSAGREATLAKFTFIVVTKRLNTRIFGSQGNRAVNPGPGTVVDDVITYPERYDFYLIAQHARQGTVSPVAYNVLYDRSGLNADKMQRLTYKLTHMYFNGSGTICVPAPCKYARKLAHLSFSAWRSMSRTVVQFATFLVNC